MVNNEFGDLYSEGNSTIISKTQNVIGSKAKAVKSFNNHLIKKSVPDVKAV